MFDCLYPIYIQFIHVFPLKAEFVMVETLSFAYVCLLNLHFWGRSATRTVLFFLTVSQAQEKKQIERLEHSNGQLPLDRQQKSWDQLITVKPK